MNAMCNRHQFALATQAGNENPVLTAARLKAISEYQILDTPVEPQFEEITRLAATICEASFAAISFVCKDRQWFKSEIGVGIRQTPISQSFCAFAIRQPDLFVVRDARQHPLFKDNPLVVGGPGISFYAGMPIIAHDGTPVATLCVFDKSPRPLGLSESQRLTLTVLAKQVEGQLGLRRAINERDDRAAQQHSTSIALQWMASHDSLTNLGNRSFFHNELNEALSRANDRGSHVALVLVDVDHFKQINDSLGHDAGDAVLCGFASRLSNMVRAGDIVARLGVDEFGIILNSITSEDQLKKIIASLSSRLHDNLNYKGRSIECRASIGVAIRVDRSVAAEELIKRSDLALGVAKSTRGCAVIFRPEMATDFQHDLALMSQARSAIEQHRVFPYYQPKMDMQTGELTGFEALMRWRQADGNLGLPNMIAPAFLDGELALRIGDRMIASVLDDMRSWVDVGLRFGRIAVNTCAGDFAANDFAERLLAALNARDLPTHLIEVEVTESVFLDRGSHFVMRALTKLSENGVQIALDDFGTGFASLTHLKKFPVDVLKIDQTFVAGLGYNIDDAAIVRAIIGLGDSLGMATVAEGIETRQQAGFLRENGCTQGQGFLLGAAMSATEIPGLLRPSSQNSNVVPLNPGYRRRLFKTER